MNNLLSFKGTQVTILTDKDVSLKQNNIAGDFLISGKEVATALGYKNTADAVLRYVYPEDKAIIRNKNIKPTSSVRQLNNAGEVFINESGMYSLIFHCTLPQAKEFKRWVTSEVLPMIRKTGSYSVVQQSQVIDEEKIRLIVEKIALENMLNMKTDKTLESIKYLRAHGITKAKAIELTRKAAKYNLSIELVLDEYLKEKSKIEEQAIEGKIKLAIVSLVKLGYTQQEAWLKFAEVASKATGKDINKTKIYWQQSGAKKTYIDIVKDMKIGKESLTAINRFVAAEKRRISKIMKSA